MKKRTFIMGLAALALAFGSAGVIGGVSLSANDSAIMTRAEEAVTTTTVTCGNAGWKIDSASSNYTDSLSTLWSATTVGTTSFTNDKSTTWAQIGASKKPATSISIVGTLGNSENVITSVSVKMGGFGSTAGTVTIMVDDVTVGTGSLNGTNDVTIASSGELSGSQISLSVTSIAKGVKIYSITYTTKPSSNPSVSIEDGSDITLKSGGTKDVALTIKNLPEGGSVSAETGDSSIATVSVNNAAMTIKGLAVGETTYTVTMKDSSGTDVASCTGKITVSVAVTEVTLASDFENNDVLKIGTTHELLTEVSPTTAAQDIVWTVSDPDAATVSSDTLTIVKKTSASLITVTAAAAADSSVTASLSFYVSNEFAISEIISQDGSKLPNGLVTDSSVVSTQGTVTAIEGNNVYIQSGSSAVELYANKATNLNSLKIGDGVKASGTITIYGGVTELASPTATVDASVKEDIVPLEIAGTDMVAKNTSRLVTAHNAKCLATTAVSSDGTKNVSVNFELSDGTAFKVYIKSAVLNKIAAFGGFTKDSYYDITGLYSLFYGSNQIVINEGCSYYPAGTEEVKKFIADYITGKDGAPAEGDTCKAKYDAAKAAYDKLSDNAKTLFTTGSDYAEAYATYTYWENHQSDASGAKLVNNSNSTNWSNIAVIAGAFLLASAASVYFFLNKKKQDR